MTEIVRGRLEGLGPVTQVALAAPLGLEPDEIGAALTALEVEGFAMRGRFTPGTNADEWCDRRLLARIHHYTVRRLRAEIEPVAARDFLRFLFAWQHVTDDTRLEGPDTVTAVRRAARRVRSTRRCVGDRAPAVTHRGIRAVLAGRSMPGGAHRLGATEPVLRPRQRPRARRVAGTDHAHHAAGTPSRAVLDVALGAARRARSRARGRRRSSTASARTALRFSRNWSRRPACCAHRWKRRSANSSPSAW